jgi:hypothetical protein
MPNLQHIGEDTNLHHFAMLGIHNLETYLAKYAAFHQWLNERGLQMTAYHDRLQAGEFLPGAQPHYPEGENPSPVAEAEAPAEPDQGEAEVIDQQPEPEAPAEEEVIVEETIVEEAPAEQPAEEAPPA